MTINITDPAGQIRQFDSDISMMYIVEELMNKTDWVILDTETTGLGDDAEIVSIGIIDPNGTVLLDQLVKPSQPIPPAATAIHGITDNMVADAPPFDEIVRHIWRWTVDKTIVVYNAPYDRRLMAQSFNPHLKHYKLTHNTLNQMIDIYRADWLDIMAPYAEYHGDWNDYHESYRWQKLTSAAAQMGVTVEGDAHRAIPDCLMTLGIIRAIAAKEF